MSSGTQVHATRSRSSSLWSCRVVGVGRAVRRVVRVARVLDLVVQGRGEEADRGEAEDDDAAQHESQDRAVALLGRHGRVRAVWAGSCAVRVLRRAPGRLRRWHHRAGWRWAELARRWAVARGRALRWRAVAGRWALGRTLRLPEWCGHGRRTDRAWWWPAARRRWLRHRLRSPQRSAWVEYEHMRTRTRRPPTGLTCPAHLTGTRRARDRFMRRPRNLRPRCCRRSSCSAYGRASPNAGCSADCRDRACGCSRRVGPRPADRCSRRPWG